MCMETVLSRIEKANAEEIEQILDAAFARKERLFPDWEIDYIALPRRDWEERQRILEYILKMEKRAGEFATRLDGEYGCRK